MAAQSPYLSHLSRRILEAQSQVRADNPRNPGKLFLVVDYLTAQDVFAARFLVETTAVGKGEKLTAWLHVYGVDLSHLSPFLTPTVDQVVFYFAEVGTSICVRKVVVFVHLISRLPLAHRSSVACHSEGSL